ncbi:UPF0193 protein EVG1 homolog [Convolutriloba macropyga]|uniref:UPF0193 protein EVG1 homolog n=1 Tax=Convolutriloba macropyga TaxID=536237 RepID=UPI003F51EAE4
MSEKPYRGVSAGGNIFDAPKVNYSAETKNLLKTMMNESKLTNFQQRKLQESVRDGNSLPPSCNPTSSENNSKAKSASSLRAPRKQHTLSGLRTRDQIMAGGGYEREKFVSTGSQTRDREKEKDRLARHLAGLDPDQVLTDEKRPTTLAEFEAQQRLIAETKQQNRLMEERSRPKDRFTELWDEINERRDFLYNMEKLGQGKDYRQLIVTEISQKIREMEVIDKKRSQELEEQLRKESMTLDTLNSKR